MNSTCWRKAWLNALSSSAMNSISQVQIFYETVCVSLHANTFAKGVNFTVGKRVAQTVLVE